MKRKILPAALLLILVLALAFALWIYFTKTKNTENVTSPILENNRPNTSSHDENPVPTPDPQTAAPASEEDTEEDPEEIERPPRTPEDLYARWDSLLDTVNPVVENGWKSPAICTGRTTMISERYGDYGALI